MLSAGDAFLLPSTYGGTEHLWIVLLDSDKSEKTIIVNLTTKKPHSDLTVVLSPGDHPFIKHETVVNYFDARLVEIKKIESALNANIGINHSPCSPDLLKKIQDGLLASEFTKTKVKDYFR